MRGYYGTFSHNAKAVYQRYLGWYDANPANLNPLPPVRAGAQVSGLHGRCRGRRCAGPRGFRQGRIPLGGGGDEPGRIRRARQHARPASLAPTRWSSWAISRNPPPGATPTCRARASCAAEWRCCPQLPRAPASTSCADFRLDLFFDLLGVRLNGEKAEGKRSVINWQFPDTGQRYALTLQNCALTYLADRHAADADCTVTLDRATLNRVILRELPLPEALAQGLVTIAGDGTKLAELFGLLDDFSMGFAIVEPQRPRAP